MSRLNDIASKAITETDSANGERNIRGAAALVIERADANEIEALAFEGARRLCASLAKRVGPSAERAMQADGQEELFPDLWQAYAVDGLGKATKLTGDLSQIEFLRIIAIREKQIADDASHLRSLREAYTAVFPIWDVHPEWLFAQCRAAFAQQRDGALFAAPAPADMQVAS